MQLLISIQNWYKILANSFPKSTYGHLKHDGMNVFLMLAAQEQQKLESRHTGNSYLNLPVPFDGNVDWHIFFQFDHVSLTIGDIQILYVLYPKFSFLLLESESQPKHIVYCVTLGSVISHHSPSVPVVTPHWLSGEQMHWAPFPSTLCAFCRIRPSHLFPPLTHTSPTLPFHPSPFTSQANHSTFSGQILNNPQSILFQRVCTLCHPVFLPFSCILFENKNEFIYHFGAFLTH